MTDDIMACCSQQLCAKFVY